MSLIPVSRQRADLDRRDFSHSPLVVFYELTQACDMVCQHCRASAQPLEHPGQLDTVEGRRLMEQLRSFPTPPMVVLTGGDPLKRRDIYELVEYGTELGLEVSMTPSATPLVTRDALCRLRDAGIVRIAISVDGADAATHDALRGLSGSYRRTLEVVLTARGLGMPVQVNTTITTANYRQIDAMAAMLAGWDVVLWSVFFLVPVGRAVSLERLSPEQYEGVFERLWWHARRQAYMIKTTEAPHYRRFAIRHSQGDKNVRPAGWPTALSSLGVNDGKGVMFIGHTGFVYPSGFLPVLCGIFPQQNVVDIYQKSPVMVALRDARRLEGKCLVCEFRKICGGSRARAYAVTGNAFSEEPDCLYEPAEWAGDSRTPA